MYMNIPLEEGNEAFKEELYKGDNKTILLEFLIRLLRLELECNVLEFNKEFWIQLLETATGTRAAPTQAIIFMNFLETKMPTDCPNHLKGLIFTQKLFIDGILQLFLGIYEQFKELFNFLNSYQPGDDENENSTIL